MAKIDEVVRQLKKMKPRALILFGSAARGEMKKDSDVDVLMIKKTNKKFHDRIADVHFQLDTNIPTDVIVLTPQEVNYIKDRNEFFKDIIDNGRLIYGQL